MYNTSASNFDNMIIEYEVITQSDIVLAGTLAPGDYAVVNSSSTPSVASKASAGLTKVKKSVDNLEKVGKIFVNKGKFLMMLIS